MLSSVVNFFNGPMITSFLAFAMRFLVPVGVISLLIPRRFFKAKWLVVFICLTYTISTFCIESIC